MPVKYESYEVGDDSNQSISGADWNAQTFTPSTQHNITSVKIYAHKIGSPSGNLVVSVRATSAGKPTGSDLTSGTILASSVGGVNSWVEIPFTSYLLNTSTKYAMVVRCPDGDGFNYINWRIDLDATGHAGSDSLYSSDAGLTWLFHAEGDNDFLFQEWGDPAFTPQVIII